jgi:hypothetical protein
MNKSSRQRLVSGTLVGGSLLAVALASCLFLWWLLGKPLRGEKPFDQQAAGSVVNLVLSSSLTPKSSGAITLPPALASNSLDGRVYVTVDSTGTTWILFPTWRGKGDNLAGYLYRSSQATGPRPATVTINGPDIASPGGTRSLEYTVDKQIDANWYHIYNDMD